MAEKIVLVAMTADRIIGLGAGLPWAVPEEMQLFRRLTLGHVVVMGRRTFQSIGGPLAGRCNIIVSRSMSPGPGFHVCPSFAEALALGEKLGGKIFFIGGVDIYRLALPVADVLAVSWMEGEFAGNVNFPDVDFSEWEKSTETIYQGFRHARYQRR